MINLAIVIAVSDYATDAHPLPACKNDGAAIAELFASSGKFTEVLLISKDTSSNTVKQQLIDFVTRHRSSGTIGDMVFYFTGHGDFRDGEFYYLLSDYSASQRKQTSLENSELDNLIRSLRPTLFAKIVDACHSGLSYVKDGGDLKKHLDASATSFNKIYFMYSSQTSQSSYQDAALSYFTRRLIESVALRSSNTMRYKDAIDYISDAFATDTIQTPFFVTQADHTEIFLESTPNARREILKFIPGAAPPSLPVKQETHQATLLDLIKSDADTYCTEDEAMAALEALAQAVQQYEFPPELQELYTLKVTQVPLSDFNYAAGIGRWIDKNTLDKPYFAKPKKEMRPFEKRVPKTGIFSGYPGLLGQLGDDDYKIATEYKEYVTGVEHSVDMPYGALAIFAEPRLLNLHACHMYLAPILSMTHIRLFWSYAYLDHQSWRKRKFINGLEWITDEALTKDASKRIRLLRNATDGFESFVFSPLRAKWGKFLETDEKQSSEAQIETQHKP